jgi:putative ATPase
LKPGVLFSHQARKPLADLVRPSKIEDVIGQRHILRPESAFLKALQQGNFTSTLFWGPPGCGKTTLAKLIAGYLTVSFVEISAVKSGIPDMRPVFEQARSANLMGQQTMVFIDEIHRFNRAQQDFLLPYVEDGSIILTAATTENPSFELSSALLSRLRVITLDRLSHNDLDQVLKRVESHINRQLPLTLKARTHLCELADGDGRMVVNFVESILFEACDEPLDVEALVDIISRRPAHYDKTGEAHYNLMSALHKSMRGSDVNAALYWFNRMIVGGEDVLYICRRLIRFASEDIGLADPQALVQASLAFKAFERLGSPEGELCVAQAVVYLSTAPKSNALYLAQKSAMALAKEAGSLSPPKSILNAPTEWMKQEGYGQNYLYDHDTADTFSGQNYFPDGIAAPVFYNPNEIGFEREIKKRLLYWQTLRVKQNKP